MKSIVQISEEKSFILQLKDQTNCNTASKAYQEAAHKHLFNTNLIDRLQVENYEQSVEIERLKDLLENITSNCLQVLEVAGQKDIFEDSH